LFQTEQGDRVMKEVLRFLGADKLRPAKPYPVDQR